MVLQRAAIKIKGQTTGFSYSGSIDFVSVFAEICTFLLDACPSGPGAHAWLCVGRSLPRWTSWLMQVSPPLLQNYSLCQWSKTHGQNLCSSGVFVDVWRSCMLEATWWHCFSLAGAGVGSSWVMLWGTKLGNRCPGSGPTCDWEHLLESSYLKVWGWVSLNSEHYLLKPTHELIIRNHLSSVVLLSCSLSSKCDKTEERGKGPPGKGTKGNLWMEVQFCLNIELIYCLCRYRRARAGRWWSQLRCQS